VVVFKNGTGFFQRTGDVAAPTADWVMEAVPPASFGSLWADAPGNTVRALTARTDTLRAEHPFASSQQFLEANRGKRVRLSLQGARPEDAPRTEEGVLQVVTPDRIGIVRAGGGLALLRLDHILTLDFPDSPSLNQATDSLAWRIRVQLARPSASQPLALYYLRGDINWTPTYRVEILAGNKARLQLRANLKNDAEDLQDVAMRFTVGVPNFRYQSMREWVADNLQTLAGQAQLRYARFDNNDPNANAMFQNVASGMLAEADEVADITRTQADLSDISGSQAQDLYFYEVPNITLPKGGRGAYLVMEEEVPYEDVYEVTLPQTNPQMRHTGDPARSLPVWHSLRLKNNTNRPWTTGAAFVVDRTNANGAPVAQDQLHYTAPNDRCKLRLTTVPELFVQQEEEEVARQTNARSRNNVSWDLVTVRAKITVRNAKRTPLKLTLERVVDGDPETCSTEWVRNTLPQTPGAYNANRLHRLEWEPTVQGGQELEITYTYKMYVRR
jgi:hypothetical protein